MRFRARTAARVFGLAAALSGAFPAVTHADTPRSCKAILDAGLSVGNGIYTIDPDQGGPLAATQVVCDMERDGGGWTLGLKAWYQAGVFGMTGAVGTAADGLTLKGNPYKLSDAAIVALTGPSQNFDVLADQAGFNSSYSTGNYEFVVLRNYTGLWRFDAPVAASTTQTTMQSYRAADQALAWTGELLCGTGGAGINCQTVVGVNPAGGSGCDINMGSQSNTSWHHFYMGETNSDTYLYICNGAQHSSSFNMNHRFWFRERTTVPLPLCDIQMTQAAYSAGQTVTASVFRFANPGAGPVAVEIKAWLSGPAGTPFSLINTGADGSVSLPASLDVNVGPVPLFTVSASFPVGSYEVSCRILNPITGAVVTQDLNPFVIE